MKKMNKKSSKASDKTSIKYQMKFIDSCKFRQPWCEHSQKSSGKKCDEFRHKCKNCKYANIKKYEEKEINIITKKFIYSWLWCHI